MGSRRILPVAFVLLVLPVLLIGGGAIKKVEVSTDGGKRWNNA